MSTEETLGLAIHVANELSHCRCKHCEAIYKNAKYNFLTTKTKQNFPEFTTVNILLDEQKGLSDAGQANRTTGTGEKSSQYEEDSNE